MRAILEASWDTADAWKGAQKNEGCDHRRCGWRRQRRGRLRRLDEQAEIVVLERTGYVSYANCGLPYYVGGVIRRKEVLTLQTPQSFRERFRVEVRVHHEAVKIDPASQTVTVQRLDDGSVYEERYDELILSPGARR